MRHHDLGIFSFGAAFVLVLTLCYHNHLSSLTSTMDVKTDDIAIANTMKVNQSEFFDEKTATETPFKEKDEDKIEGDDIFQRPFQRQEGVVVVTKVHGPTDLKMIRQFLCLFTQAYNKDVQYNIIVFTTAPWDQKSLEEILKVSQPANLTVVLDSQYTLEEKIKLMTDDEVAYLLKRCKANSVQNLTWWNYCSEDGFNHVSPLKYAWQSTFRSYEIWKHPALTDYNYMMWLDTDALPTRPWTRDPVKFAVKNELAIFFDNFPQGTTGNKKLQEKMKVAYNNRFICGVKLNEGRLEKILPDESGNCQKFGISLIHGFFHITNLNFYRNEINLNFLENFVETFSREWDDQIAVTVPAAMEAPDRAWSMREHGFKMDIYHNGARDGKEPIYPRGYKNWFKRGKDNQPPGRESWPEAQDACDRFVTEGGR